MGKTKRNRPFIVITLAACLLSSLLLFTSLDNKFFDLFLRLLPSLTENEKVYVLTLDDDSISYAGGFPFRRDVMADVVLLLKELGVKSIAFDLNYLDDSPYRFDPVYAKNVFGKVIDSGFASLDDASNSVIDGISPATKQEDRDLYREDILGLHKSVKNDIESSLSFLMRDADEYFAQALAFSDCSWLTLTMIRPQDLLGKGEIANNADVDSYLANHIALENVTDRGDTKTPEMAGVAPAIQKLLSRARGAGLVSAYPDQDGLWRRVPLLLKYKDRYYGQLTLVALREMLGYTSMEVTNKTITLKKNNDVLLRIPRAQDGTMLLKWPKKSFYDYREMSLVQLVQYAMIEPVFAQNISLMHDSGYFSYWDGGLSPWDYYVRSEDLRKAAFAQNGSAGADWLEARQGFFHSCESFLTGPYEDRILAAAGNDSKLTDSVRSLFDACRDQFNRMAAIRKDAAALKDSFCVIGSDATSMKDNGPTTFEENYPLSGTYATVANMLLSGEFINDAPRYIPAIIALLYSLAIGFFVSRFDTHLSIITGVSGLILLGGAFVVFFLLTKIYLGIAVPLVATALSFVSLMVTKFLTASHERTFLHDAFSRYLAPEVVSEIINDPGKLNLGGEKREMTALFTDIQGFSTISEQLDPANLVRLLNRYLTAMSNIIMEKLGTIDKYEGDAIIAFFGAPVFHAAHPALACRSALAMKAAERELNNTIVQEGLSPAPLFTRIGINTGEMVVGNMGAENKMDYTIMGNAVNLAARLEGVNKQYHTGGILISEYTRAKIGDEFLLRRLDRVRVVGIHTPLRLYELLAAANDEESINTERKTLDSWEKAIDLYDTLRFAEALRLFVSLAKYNPNDKVARLYAARCKMFIKNPPPPDWNAVNNLKEK